MATNVCASTTAVVLNGTVIPNVSSSQAPTSPRRPKTSSSATPPTTGGSTSGTVTRARTNRRPGNGTRASSQARGTPRTRQSRVARVAVCTDSRNAVSTPGSVSRCGRVAQGVRASNPTSGSRRNSRPIAAGSSSATGTRRGRLSGRRTGYGTWNPAAVNTARPALERRCSTKARAAAGLAASVNTTTG